MIKFESAMFATIKPPPCMAVSITAKAMRAKGESVVDLSLGEPDFDTPSHVVEAMCKGLARYTARDGLAEFRQAIVAASRMLSRLRRIGSRRPSLPAADGFCSTLRRTPRGDLLS